MPDNPFARIIIAVYMALAALSLAAEPVSLPESDQISTALRPATADGCALKLVEAAIEQTKSFVVYDGSYRRLSYPGGDVPADRGVCTDVVIRAYRRLGIDLQVEIHEDMRRHFSIYPGKWGLKKPDTNIDHRRVPNMQVFFQRHGRKLPVTQNAGDYIAGDLVTWVLPGNLPHIGIVTDRRSEDGLRPLIVHNIGGGTVLEDMLFAFTITGHYRYCKKIKEISGE